MALPFVDTNIFLCHLRNNEPNHAPRAAALFAEMASWSYLTMPETLLRIDRKPRMFFSEYFTAR